ncbi:pyridoxal phosphate-dependent aminotransferase [Candidatus Woesearchaeota archaeon]|nr:pyridoxal phosphate-dependent aminotransferase [Candidatus Woesearchaeota archaeon]
MNIIPKSPTASWFEMENKISSKFDSFISLSLGDTILDFSKNIKKTIFQQENKFNYRYSAISGSDSLKQAISKYNRHYAGGNYLKNEIIVTNGGKQGIFNVLLTLINPGDEVLLPRPYWDTYLEIINFLNGKAILIKTDGNYNMDIDDLSKKITSKAKLIIINSPNNPSGAIIRRSSLKKIADLAIENNIHILSDEVYNAFLYNDEKYVSISSLSQEAKERTIVVNSFSKSLSIPGLRVGYCASSKEMISKLENIQSHSTGNVSNVSQHIALGLLEHFEKITKDTLKTFNKRIDYSFKRLKEMQNTEMVTKPAGAIYLFPKIMNGGEDAYYLCKKLLETRGVSFMPGKYFGLKDHLRITVSHEIPVLDKALTIFEEFLEENEKRHYTT